MEEIKTEYTELVEKILADKQVHYVFNQENRLQIDKKLPFLLVFRHENLIPDLDVEGLVRGESAYLILQGKEVPDYIRQFLHDLTERMAEEFGSFLLLDVWLSDDNDEEIVIHYPEKKLTATVEALKEGLSDFSKVHRRLKVSCKAQTGRDFSALVDGEVLRTTGSEVIELEVPSLFSHRESGAAYPVLFRSFKDHFSEVLRKALYNFVRIQTSLHISNYYVLGRSSVDDAFWEADHALAEIQRSFDFLLLVSAINTQQAWDDFRRNAYQKDPAFHYRVLNIDPESLKKKIYAIDLDKVHDPALSFLLRDKRNELDKQLNMLLERNCPDFLYSSVRLYKTIDQRLLDIAEYILEDVQAEDEKENMVPPQQFAAEARKEFAYFKEQDESFTSDVHIRSDVPGLMVSKGQLYMTSSSLVRESRITSLIQHEVGTHILTFHNGKKQPMHLLRYGLADYDELQEGLAVLAEYLTGGLDALRMRLLAARVIAANALLKGESFCATFQLLHEQYKFDAKTAFGVTTRIYQAGGYTKDVIYLRGLLQLLDYLKKGGEVEPLLMGKVAVKHLGIMQELRARGILKPPAIRPRYMTDKIALEKLDKVKKGVDLKVLVKT